MDPVLQHVSRRKFLAGVFGVSLAYVFGRPGLALSTTDSTKQLVWVWQFSEDGEPDAIGRTLLEHDLGIVLKTHDGPRWMADYDTSDYGVSGPHQVQVLASYFENAGIPFHAWAVVQGFDPLSEATMAAEVLQAGARSLFLDLGADGQSWQGDEEAARVFGEELRRLQPEGNIVLVADARPWLSESVPLQAIAPFCDSMAVKALWESYENDADIEAFAASGHSVPEEGITPEFVYGVGSASLDWSEMPRSWIADGSTEDGEEMARFLTIARNGGASPGSIWRYGTATPAAYGALAKEAEVLEQKEYQVQSGDTLSSIATDHDVSLDELIAANELADPDFLSESQTLIIP